MGKRRQRTFDELLAAWGALYKKIAALKKKKFQPLEEQLSAIGDEVSERFATRGHRTAVTNALIRARLEATGGRPKNRVEEQAMTSPPRAPGR